MRAAREIPLSLRLRLVASITFVLLVTLAAGSALIYRHAVDKVETEMRAAIAVGSRIAQNAADDAEEVRNPRRRLELLVADFNGDRHLKASLIDANGLLVMVSTVAPPRDDVPQLLLWLLAGKQQKVPVALPAVFDGYGSIVLETTSTNEIGEVWEDVRLYLGILATFSISVLALTYLIIGRVLAPLKDLVGAFARIGSGDYAARVTPVGPKELVQLCSGFNDMGERLLDMDEKNKRLRAQLDTVQEEERAELARDLHDDVSPLLFSVDVDATMIKQLATNGAGQQLLARADAIRDAVGDMKKKVKAILGRLRPSLLDPGLATTVDNLVASWQARYPDIVFSVDVPAASWGAQLDSTLHHLVRESVSNALKHAKPRRIDVSIRRGADNCVVLEVADDGAGLKAPAAPRGYGITGMTERSARLGGRLSVENRRDGEGVVVTASIPLPEAKRAGPDAREEEASAA
jgi:two-component system sensor histidine kinase UhpB